LVGGAVVQERDAGIFAHGAPCQRDRQQHDGQSLCRY
jgi:hypothetical protein